MPNEIMNTREVAKYLGIHEKQVYALIKAQRIPATRVTGKWVFPKKLIDEWIEKNARHGMNEARERSKKMGDALLAAGSNDPLLDMLHNYMRKKYPEFYVFYANVGSTEGLKALKAGHTDIAYSHLLDPPSGQYNIPFIAHHLSHLRPVVVNLFHRDLGLVVAPKNPLHIQRFEDLARPEIKFINRQEGSGTRVLLDYYLQRLGIKPSRIKGYDKEVYTHFEVGLAILSGQADVGLATIAVSKLLGLSFMPIIQESFDMILDQSTYFRKDIQAFIDILNSKDFRSQVGWLGNYDFSSSGKIIYS